MTAAALSYARSTGRPRRLAIDPWVIGPVAALLLVGLVMVASASIGVSDRETEQPFFYFERQVVYVLLGLLAAAIAVTIPTAIWEKYSMVLLAIGMVLDGVSIFLIFVPLLMPLMRAYAWDPVWFGVILTYMVAIGQFTPPLAVNLMVSARLAGVKIEDTVRWVLWFVLAMLLLLVLLITFPQISLWLPRTLNY